MCIRDSSFEDPATRKGEARIEQGLRTLVHSLSRLGKGRVEIREVDGEKPRSSALADLLPRAGFRTGYRGFEAEAPRGG